MNQVTDNAEQNRFELIEEGKMAYADYRFEGEVLVIPYVFADPALRGKGTSGRLMEGMLEIVRERNLKIKPVCSYAVAYLNRHSEYQDLLV